MKKRTAGMLLSLCLLLVLSLGNTALAGEIEVIIDEERDNEEMAFEDEIGIPSQMASGFRANGGPMLALLLLDVEELNKELDKGDFEGFDEEFLLFGGSGIVGARGGSRFGGYGVGGTTTTHGSNGERAVLTVNYGGLLYEHAIYAQGNTDITLGGVFGGGSANLDLIHSDPAGFDTENAHSTSYKKEFIMLEPKITLHQQLGAFVGLNASLGYLGTYDFGTNWDFFGKSYSGPLGNFHGPTLSIRLSFGF